MKYQEILDGDWENLIILDACRYDMFKAMYKEYFDGNLHMRVSRGTSTSEWLYNTFTEQLTDVTYISANPYINSKGIGFDELETEITAQWNAVAYFDKIIDLWATHWDENIGTVRPEDVNEAAKAQIGDNRLIIHYIQPHQPYLLYQGRGHFWVTKMRVKQEKPENKMRRILGFLTHLPFTSFLFHLISQKIRWKIKRVLLGKELDVLRMFIAEGREEDLIKLYKANLAIVLRGVSKLLPHLPGKTVITSDHGEAFGEYNDYGHKSNSTNPYLRIVPWCVCQDTMQE